MSKSSIDTLIEEGMASKIIINDREYVIKKFNAITYFKLGKFVAKIGKVYAKTWAQFGGGSSDAADIILLLDVLNEDDFLELVSIFLGEPDKTVCAKIEMDELLKVIEMVCKYNDFTDLLKNVVRVMSGMLKTDKPATTNG